jgi:hypothetical protein
MLIKNCPRCRGDMYLEKDLDGIELVCLQCGKRLRPSFAYSRAPAITSGRTPRLPGGAA